MKNDNEIFKSVLTRFVVEEDPLLAMLEWMMKQLMEIEVANKLGAQRGEHSPERQGYLSGYRPRRFDTRLGTAYLLIPKVRKGGYVPFFLTERRRSEQALISMVKEAYVNGVSTRKIERLAKELGIESLSASQVSQINKGLDEQVQAFRERPLEESYPFVWVDALYEKVRDYDGKVVSKAIMIAYGVNQRGKKEILAVEPFGDESKATWQAFFDKLKARGLKKIALLISDAHAGIKAAFTKSYRGSWQRCKVHFMRNVLALISPRAKKEAAEGLKEIWLQKKKDQALEKAKEWIERYEKHFPEATEKLKEGLEESLQFYYFPQINKARISSTNVIERINKEVRRRSRVIAVFPSTQSYMRLMTSYLMEYTEDWEVERSYIQPAKLEEVMIIYEERLAREAA
jgi:putative transposase